MNLISFDGALDAVSSIANRVFDLFDGDEKRQFEIAMETLKNEAVKIQNEHEQTLADKRLLEQQLEVAKEQAKHKSIFVSGAGAFIKWVVGIAVLLNMLLFPLFNWIALLIDPKAPQIHINLQDMIKMFLPLFGIGG